MLENYPDEVLNQIIRNLYPYEIKFASPLLKPFIDEVKLRNISLAKLAHCSFTKMTEDEFLQFWKTPFHGYTKRLIFNDNEQLLRIAKTSPEILQTVASFSCDMDRFFAPKDLPQLSQFVGLNELQVESAGTPTSELVWPRVPALVLVNFLIDCLPTVESLVISRSIVNDFSVIPRGIKDLSLYFNGNLPCYYDLPRNLTALSLFEFPLERKVDLGFLPLIDFALNISDFRLVDLPESIRRITSCNSRLRNIEAWSTLPILEVISLSNCKLETKKVLEVGFLESLRVLEMDRVDVFGEEIETLTVRPQRTPQVKWPPLSIVQDESIYLTLPSGLQSFSVKSSLAEDIDLEGDVFEGLKGIACVEVL